MCELKKVCVCVIHCITKLRTSYLKDTIKLLKYLFKKHLENKKICVRKKIVLFLNSCFVYAGVSHTKEGDW